MAVPVTYSRPAGASAHPSDSQVTKNGYTFRLDRANRTTRTSGELNLEQTAPRSTHNQREAGRPDRRADDDGGHFIASRFNGPSDKFNHFARNANFNRGGYRAMEDRWADDLRAGKHVSVTIAAHYPGSSRRPDVLDVSWKANNGQPYSRRFSNEREGKARGH